MEAADINRLEELNGETDDPRAVFEADKRQRAADCQAAIQQACSQHNCIMEVTPKVTIVIDGHAVTPQAIIKPQ